MNPKKLKAIRRSEKVSLMGNATFSHSPYPKDTAQALAPPKGVFKLTCSSDRDAVRVVPSSVALLDGADELEFALSFEEFLTDNFEAKDLQQEGERTICILALPFDDTYDFGYGTIKFSRTAFDDSLADINRGEQYFYLAADGHTLDALYLLGRSDVKSGDASLKAYTNDKGLWLTGQLPDTQAGRDAFELIKLGVLTKASVGISFDDETDSEGKPTNYTMDKDEDGNRHYLYKKVKLEETSLVAQPAFANTTVMPLSSDIAETVESAPVSPAETETMSDMSAAELFGKYLTEQLKGALKETEALSAENNQLRSQLMAHIAEDSVPATSATETAELAQDEKTEVNPSQNEDALWHCLTKETTTHG